MNGGVMSGWPDTSPGPGRDFRTQPALGTQAWPFAPSSPAAQQLRKPEMRVHVPGRCDSGGGRHSPDQAAQLNKPVPLVVPRPDKIQRDNPQGRRPRFDYTGWHLARHHSAPDRGPSVRDLLGHDNFDEAPTPRAKPKSRAVVPKDMHGIGELGKLLKRKPGTIRGWLRGGILPEATHRGPGGGWGLRRYWTDAEVAIITGCAHRAGLLGGNGRDVNVTETEFSHQVLSGLERLHAREEAEVRSEQG